MGALELRAAALAHRFAPTSIGNVLWALTKMGVRPGPTLLDALEARAEDTAGSFANPELVNLVWALGELSKSGDGLWRPAPDLLAALDARAAAIAPGFDPSELTLVRALGEIRRPPNPPCRACRATPRRQLLFVRRLRGGSRLRGTCPAPRSCRASSRTRWR